MKVKSKKAKGKSKKQRAELVFFSPSLPGRESLPRLGGGAGGEYMQDKRKKTKVRRKIKVSRGNIP